VPAEERREGVSAWSTTQATEGFEHGEVRFTGPVVLDALPTPDVELPVLSGCPQEGVDERRLAEPGFSGDEDDLAAPGSRPLERLVETVNLRSPPNRYEPGIRGRAFAGTPWRQDYVGGVVRIPPGGEVPHEPIPAAVDGLDEEGGARVVPERLPQLPDAYHENHVGHHGVPPDGVEQGGLRQQPARLGDEGPQQGECLGPQGYRPAAAPEALVTEVQLDRGKDLGRHASRSA
jgi:hypothetical protein